MNLEWFVNAIISVCIIAADISPIDVLSHLPILCEEKGVPYIYVRSRAEVGEACKTKRPTSCVFIQTPSKKSDEYKKFNKCEAIIRERNAYINWMAWKDRGLNIFMLFS